VRQKFRLGQNGVYKNREKTEEIFGEKINGRIF
jgi:hypothetical protein